MPAALARISTEIVVFTVRDESLCVLLTASTDEVSSRHRLPGGFVRSDEDLDMAARRCLTVDTGLSGIYLEQLYTFGGPERVPGERVVSVAHYALVPIGDIDPGPMQTGRAASWYSVEALPDLEADHEDIVRLAHQRLCAKFGYSTIGLQLMPRTFTLSAVQRVFEAVLREPLDKRNFRKRLLGLDCLEDTGHEVREGNHRPARLYRAKSPGQVEIIK